LSPAVLLNLGLAICAFALAAWRVYVLGVRAALDLEAFRATLERRVSARDHDGAVALCRALPNVWAAQSALAMLEEAEPSDDVLASYGFEAQRGLTPLFTLSRMALPLALASAIVVLSQAFTANETQDAQRALGSALQCLTVGLLSMLFCRSALGFLQRQARARMHEIRAVATALRM
jgi:hypothetical protein